MPVVIRAGTHGFSYASGSGRALPPPLFFQSHWDREGRFFAATDDPAWQAVSAPVDIGLITEDTPHPLYPGQEAELVLYTATLSQHRADGDRLIASIHIPDGLSVTARFEAASGISPAGWTVSIADTFAQAVAQTGLRFIGSDAVDLFDPAYAPARLSQTSMIRLRGGDDTATGTSGDDQIAGGDGNDRIMDAGGTNTLLGQTGDDHIALGRSSDNSVARGGAGNDTLISDRGSDSLFGNRGDDRLIGGHGDDFLKGGSGADTLFGGSGDDRLLGGGQDDILCAGAGTDDLWGNSGADHFIFYHKTDGTNRIADFGRGADKILFPDWVGGFADLTIEKINADLHLTLPDTRTFTLILEGLSISELSAADFIFGA